MTFKKKVTSLMLTALFVMGGIVGAQQQQQQQQQQPQQQQPMQQQKNYSDEDIDLFANSLVKAMPIQQETEQKMIKEIENEGMELDKFNQIARQMQQGGQPEGVSEDEMQTFQDISEKIQGIQMEAQKEVNDIISEEGMTPAKYQEMIGAYSSNPELKQKVDQKLAELQPEGQQQPQQ